MALLCERECIVDAGKTLAFIGKRAGEEKKTAIYLGAKEGKGRAQVTKAFGNDSARSLIDQTILDRFARRVFVVTRFLRLTILGFGNRRQHW